MQKILVLLLTVFLTTLALGDPPAPSDFYDASKDGLSVEDVEKLSPLDADQKKMAAAILEYYVGGPSSKWTQCCSNLKNLGTAAEMWSTDYDGKYPSDLKPLSPSYLYVNLSCPTSDNKPYEYSLNNGIYLFKCPGDHSELGVAPPTYNGESGLDYQEPKPHNWKLVSFTVEEPVDQYATAARVKETWTWGDQTHDFRSQMDFNPSETTTFGRSWSLTDQDVAIQDSQDVLKLMDATFREDILVSKFQLADALWEMSPAAVSVTVVEYLKNPEFADSRQRLLKGLED
jgi:hypothetical protein